MRSVIFQHGAGIEDPWKVYHDPMPGHIYVLSGDSASGIPGRHGSAAHVINVNLHRVEAVMAATISPESFADELALAGRWYNNAVIAVEAMFHGLLVNYKLMDELHYPVLFQHEGSMTTTRPRLSSEVGWKQTEANRNLLLSLLQVDLAYNGAREDKLRRNALICEDVPTLQECSHFHRNVKGKAEAEQGFADDRVMSLGIANAVYHTIKKSIPTHVEVRQETEWEKWQKLKGLEAQDEAFGMGAFNVQNY